MTGIVDTLFGPSKPKELKTPEPTIPTAEEISLESQKAVAQQRKRDTRRRGYSSTILTPQGGGKTLLGE